MLVVIILVLIVEMWGPGSLRRTRGLCGVACLIVVDVYLCVCMYISIYVCDPCAGAMLIFSVSFQL